MPVIDSSYGIAPVFPSQSVNETAKKPKDDALVNRQDQLSRDRAQGDRLAEYRRQDNAANRQRAENEAITQRSERRVDPEGLDTALDRLRHLATRNGAVVPPIALAAAQTDSPLIGKNDFLSDEFAFDVQSEHFVARQRSGELAVEPEIRAGRAIEGVVGTFSPVRIDLPTDMLLRRESERNITFAAQTAEAYRRFETEENQKIDQENAVKWAEDTDQVKRSEDDQMIKISTEALSERDAAPPQLPVVDGQGPDFSDTMPTRQDPLHGLGQLINVEA